MANAIEVVSPGTSVGLYVASILLLTLLAQQSVRLLAGRSDRRGIDSETRRHAPLDQFVGMFIGLAGAICLVAGLVLINRYNNCRSNSTVGILLLLTTALVVPAVAGLVSSRRLSMRREIRGMSISLVLIGVVAVALAWSAQRTNFYACFD